MSYTRIVPPLLATLALMVASCNRQGPLFQKKVQTQAPAVVMFDSLSTDAIASTEPGFQARRLGKNVNSAYSDFSPYRYADRLYFSTTNTKKIGQAHVNQVYSSIQEAPPVLWAENSKEPGKHTSNIAMTANGQRIYYTVCEDQPGGGQHCEIYTRERAFEGHWLPFRRLPRSINVDGFTTTQPSIGFDYTLRKEVLYFVSDRPGGKGGLDIWCSPIETNGTYATPFSLPINSAADDVTPFAYQQGRSLFFSSNRPGTKGGFDIFKSVKTGATWDTPNALGEPFNSAYDDLYFSCHQASGKTYFSSDRPGCRTTDPAQACTGYDIFEAQLLTELKVEAVMAYNDGAVSDAMVQLVEVPTGEAVPPSDASNRHFFIKPNKQYQVAVSAPGFSTETLDLETTPNDALSVIQRKVGLRQSAKLVVQAFSALDSLPLRDVDFTYSNEKGPQPLTNQNTSKAADYSFQVAFGDKSKLVATKPGYQPAVVNLDLPNGNGPSPVLNLDVYLQPFAVLPISLYFDNDQPKWPNPTDNEQNLTYEQTLNEYLARKPIFVEKYTEGLAQNAYETARQQMLSFFDKDVAQGMQALNELCAQIEPYLKKGYRLEMLTEGEASPLASFDYNKQLSERRLSSIRNYLKVWNNGALKSYLYSGHLTLSTKFVQQKMPADTATEPVLAADRRQVEFSPASSLMRKIVIREVRLQNKV